MIFCRPDHALRGFAPKCKLAALVIAVVVLLVSMAKTEVADAHAMLERTTPAQDAKLAQAPDTVELVFNERLDSAAATLEVLDQASRSVTGNKPERIAQGKGIRLALPKLGEGNYTVSYRVISADGHPISGAYVFTVGNPPSPTAETQTTAAGSAHEHEHGVPGQGLTVQQFLLYASRVAYYAALLLLSGLLVWSAQRNAAAAVRETRETSIGQAVRFMLLAEMMYFALHTMNLSGGFLPELANILTGTTIGMLLGMQLLLSVAAFWLAKANLALRLLWTAVMLGSEAWSGHAAAFTPISYTIALDFVHLAAAAVWAGGLLLLMLVWRKERSEAARFALLFSRWALYAFLLLWATGTLSVLAYLPTLSYLPETAWGKWLIAKAALSLAVAVAAAFIRLNLRRGGLPSWRWLRSDFSLMAAIVLCVGILTYQNPIPANQPLYYHEMGTDVHVTLSISPNVPGTNMFLVKIWLPEASGNPKQIEFRLRPLDGKEIGPILVPLQPDQDNAPDEYPGFVKSIYRAEGAYLPFAGDWEAEIRVMDANDNEMVRTTTFRIY